MNQVVDEDAKASPISYSIDYGHGNRQVIGDGPPVFTLRLTDESQLRDILTGDDYSVARAFIQGQFDIDGDIGAAIQWKHKNSEPDALVHFWNAAPHFLRAYVESWFQSRERAAEDIRFHYDRSNEFYKKFLDSHLVYSAGDFANPNWSLEQAQEANLDRICAELNLRPGERFLDVGCGWGGLLTHAAERYKVEAVGCTLSHLQYEFSKTAISALRLEEHAVVREIDYGRISQSFDKIASIGMFEHVGRRRLAKYFKKVYSLLNDRGLFLNSGITRPQPVKDDSQTWLLLTDVFPGGELPHLSDLVRDAEDAGFEILKIDSLRTDYARTCRAWVERLRKNVESCQALVGRETFRTWLLYLSASALNFEIGETDVFRMLMTKHAAS